MLEKGVHLNNVMVREDSIWTTLFMFSHECIMSPAADATLYVPLRNVS